MFTKFFGADLSESEINDPILVLMLDQEGKIVFANKLFEKTVGRTLREIKNIPIFEVLKPLNDYSFSSVGEFTGFDYNTLPFKFCTKTIKDDGLELNIQWTHNKLLNKDEKPDRITLYGKVISDEQRDYYLDEFQYSINTKFQNKQNLKFLSKPVFMIIDKNGRINEINQDLCDTLNYDRNELLNKTIKEIDVDNKISENIKIKGNFNNNNPVPLNVTFRTKEGNLIDSQLNLIHFDNSKHIFIYSSGIRPLDSISNQNMQQETDIENLSLSKVFDNFDSGIIIHDINGKILYANKYFNLLTAKNNANDEYNDNLLSYVTSNSRTMLAEYLNNLKLMNQAASDIEFIKLNGDIVNLNIKSYLYEISNKDYYVSVLRENNKSIIFNNFLELFSMPVLLIDGEGKLIEANSVFLEIIQCKEDEVKNSNISQFIMMPTEQVKSLLKEAMDKTILKTSMTIKSKTNKVYNTCSSIRYLHSDSKFIIQINDVTELIRLQRELKEIKEKNSALLMSNRDLIYRVYLQPKFKYEVLTDNIEEFTGYTEREFTENPYLSRKLIHPDEREKIKQLLNTHKYFNSIIETKWLTKNGETIWVEEYNVPIIGEDNKVIGYIGRARNINELIRLKYDIEKLKELQKCFSNNEKIKIAILNSNFKIMWANKAFADTFGQVLNTNCWQIYKHSTEKCSLCKLFNGGKDLSFCYIENPIDNSMPPKTWIISAPIIGENGSGTVDSVLQILVDHDKLDLINVKNKELNQIKSEYLSFVTQINNQLQLLNELFIKLSSCFNMEHVYKCILQYLPPVLKGFSFCLYILDPHTDSFNMQLSYGKNSHYLQRTFSIDDCLACRKQTTHIASYYPKAESKDICRHFVNGFNLEYADIPLFSDGNIIGILEIINDSSSSIDSSLRHMTKSDIELTGLAARYISNTFTRIKMCKTFNEGKIKDFNTGVFTGEYIDNLIERDTKIAPRLNKLIGIISLTIKNMEKLIREDNLNEFESLNQRIVTFLKNNCRPEEIIGKYSNGKYVIILPFSTGDLINERFDNIKKSLAYFNNQNQALYESDIEITSQLKILPEQRKNLLDIINLTY